jgi:dissimilatory sulfite reductase (desulfoviridin) alpha/beta subunit
MIIEWMMARCGHVKVLEDLAAEYGITEPRFRRGDDECILCGSCTRCMQACPTDCIRPDRTLDARRCIAYLTVELRGSIPAELRRSRACHPSSTSAMARKVRRQ